MCFSLHPPTPTVKNMNFMILIKKKKILVDLEVSRVAGLSEHVLHFPNSYSSFHGQTRTIFIGMTNTEYEGKKSNLKNHTPFSITCEALKTELLFASLRRKTTEKQGGIPLGLCWNILAFLWFPKLSCKYEVGLKGRFHFWNPCRVHHK